MEALDPNETLRELREYAQLSDQDEALDAFDVARMGELVRTLDEWLSKGGYLPDDWHEWHSACPKD